MRMLGPFSIAFMIFCGGHVYVGARMMAYFRLSAPFSLTAIAWLVYTFISFSYFIGMYLGGSFLGKLCRVIGGYWLIAFIYILIGFAALDLFSLLMKLKTVIFRSPAWLAGPGLMKAAGLIVLSCSAVLVIYGSFHAKRIITAEYKVESFRSVSAQSETCAGVPIWSPDGGLGAGQGAAGAVRIALISDLHIGSSVDAVWLRQIVDSVNRAKPDLVCVAGDIFDNNLYNISDLDRYGEILRGISAPLGVYAVLGNHDVERMPLIPASSGEAPVSRPGMGIRQFLKENGVRLLEDETELIDGRFYIAGRKDARPISFVTHSRLTAREVIAGWDKKLPLIMLDHQPTEIDQIAATGADLLLCGHTHRGQVFPAKYITGGMFEVDYGYARKGDTHVIVTSGAGLWGPPVRIGTNSEVVIIDYSWN